ncbi:hypothetical protein [Undibacterium oligocarboniphilum]|uniref:Uncharacterized protein n=1 Tax=Undibacterium oligocarboniphilum TaxID=666702 RepID=A0A850QTS4_9BURK|nr:hypothetical protein [Undibacterium oligocarboniphilum]MBC3871760.1 hypothetical protein [Undibacterium oligocarboniphilum]NVO79396.1 hypothetical protein [Undibacterium oligocarboniphilum]
MKISKLFFSKEVAQEVIFAADMITSRTTREIDCTGNENLGVTCKAIGQELFTINFTTTFPMPDFRIHVVRENNSLDIRQATGLPLHRDSPDIEKILKVFNNPILSQENV